MSWIVVHMDRVLIVCGALTATMLFPMIAPRIAFKSIFGEATQGAVGRIADAQLGADDCRYRVPADLCRVSRGSSVANSGIRVNHEVDFCLTRDFERRSLRKEDGDANSGRRLDHGPVVFVVFAGSILKNRKNGRWFEKTLSAQKLIANDNTQNNLY